MDRNQATNLTLIMGVIYLIYSAYFLASDSTGGIGQFVNGMMAFIYIVLGVVNFKSLSD